MLGWLFGYLESFRACAALRWRVPLLRLEGTWGLLLWPVEKQVQGCGGSRLVAQLDPQPQLQPCSSCTSVAADVSLQHQQLATTVWTVLRL